MHCQPANHIQLADCYYSSYDLSVQQYFNQTTNNCCRQFITATDLSNEAVEDGHRFMGCEGLLIENAPRGGAEQHNYHLFPRHPGQKHDHDNTCTVCDPLYWSTDTPNDHPIHCNKENSVANYSLSYKQQQQQHTNTNSSQQSIYSTSSSQTMEIVKRVRELESEQQINSSGAAALASCSFQIAQQHSNKEHKSTENSSSTTDQSSPDTTNSDDLQVFQFVDTEINVNQDEAFLKDYKPTPYGTSTRAMEQILYTTNVNTYEPVIVKRKKKTQYQLMLLEDAFKKTPLLDSTQRSDLARLANLGTEEVKLWFKYRRQRARNALREDPSRKEVGFDANLRKRIKIRKHSDSDS